MKRESFALVALLLLALSVAAVGQETVKERCEKLNPSSPRQVDNQPIPEQLKIANAPRTARQVSCFRSFNSESRMLDVVRKCGIPDKHLGSGVYIFGYYMNDCPVVSVSTGDLQHISITHVNNGRSTVLLKAQAAYPKNKPCTYEEGRRALDQADMLHSWDTLYNSYKRFGHRDDGAIGEGFSESVARILVDHWNTLSRLAQLARQDAAFRAFVISHIDATLNMDDVEKIKQNGRMHCPTGLRTTCTELTKQADSALNEASSP